MSEDAVPLDLSLGNPSLGLVASRAMPPGMGTHPEDRRCEHDIDVFAPRRPPRLPADRPTKRRRRSAPSLDPRSTLSVLPSDVLLVVLKLGIRALGDHRSIALCCRYFASLAERVDVIARTVAVVTRPARLFRQRALDMVANSFFPSLVPERVKEMCPDAEAMRHLGGGESVAFFVWSGIGSVGGGDDCWSALMFSAWTREAIASKRVTGVGRLTQVTTTPTGCEKMALVSGEFQDGQPHGLAVAVADLGPGTPDLLDLAPARRDEYGRYAGQFAHGRACGFGVKEVKDDGRVVRIEGQFGFLDRRCVLRLGGRQSRFEFERTDPCEERCTLHTCSWDYHTRDGEVARSAREL